MGICINKGRAGLLLLLLLLIGCRHRGDVVPALPVENAAYYWRTTWSLDSTETAFLQEHDIERVFCRYFDVVMTDGQPMPNATIHFDSPQQTTPEGEGSPHQPPPEGEAISPDIIQHDSLPLGGRLVGAVLEIIPTVYITEDCMSKAPKGGWPGLAEKLVARVVQMNDTHDLPPARELQVDCDYTLRSRKTYYDFLADVRREAKRHGMALSTTIRLHQLSMPAPPADYGVLMVYNTGDPKKFTERNPILDLRDVQPYMRYLPDYPLPLAAAYPVYAWQRTIGGVRIEHTVDSTEILSVKKMVEQTRNDMSNTILIYSLDKKNINRYDHDTYRKIYRR